MSDSNTIWPVSGRLVAFLTMALAACSPSGTSATTATPPTPARTTAIPAADLCAELSREAAADAAGDDVGGCRAVERSAEAYTVRFLGTTTTRAGRSLTAVTVSYRLPLDDGELGYRSRGHEAQLSVRHGDVTVHVTHYTADPRRFRRASRRQLARLLP